MRVPIEISIAGHRGDAVIVVPPGAHLVVSYPAGISPERAVELRARLQQLVPGLADRVLLLSGAEQLAVVQPDQEGDDRGRR